MSLEHEQKTLGINNWRFNQDGFEDGGRVYVCVCLHVVECMPPTEETCPQNT